MWAHVIVPSLMACYCKNKGYTYASSEKNNTLTKPQRKRRIVVIGGGICGISTSITLASLGHHVTLLERDTIGSPYQASAINSGFIESFKEDVSHENELIESKEILENYSLEDVLLTGSKAMFKNLQEKDKYDISYIEMGLIWAIQSLEQLQLAMAEYPISSSSSSHPVSGSVLTKDQVIQLHSDFFHTGSKIYGGIYFPKCATANPRKVMMALKDKAVNAGVIIHERSEVFAITLKNKIGDQDDQKEEGDVYIVQAKPYNRTRHDCNFNYKEGVSDVSIKHDCDSQSENKVDSKDDIDKHSEMLEVECDTLVIASGGLTPFVSSILPFKHRGVPVIPVVGQMFSTPSRKDLHNYKVELPPTRLNFLIASFESHHYWTTNPKTIPPNITHVIDEEVDDEEKVKHRGGHWKERMTRHLYGKQNNDGSFIFGGDRRIHPTQDISIAHPLPRNNDDFMYSTKQHAGEILPILDLMKIDKTWAGIMPFSSDGLPLIGQVEEGKEVFVVCGLAASGFMRGPMAGKLLALLIDEGENFELIKQILTQASLDRFNK